MNKKLIDEHDYFRDASGALDDLLNKINFKNTKIHIVVGYPRSDIGKAELAARLGLLLQPNFSIIKVDGFLNTNKDGRHPSRVRNDFVVYKKFHEKIVFGGYHLILSAPLMQEFFERFGECEEHLTYCPHLAKFFIVRVYENWVSLGKPDNLIIEIGGTISDYEVKSYILPGLVLLKESYPGIRFFLLTEAGYNGDGIKVRPIITALETSRGLGLKFDIVFARLPMSFPDFEKHNINVLNQYVKQKLRDSMVCGLQNPMVLCIPFFKNSGLEGYSEYLYNFKTSIFPYI